MKLNPHNPFSNLVMIYREYLLLEDHLIVGTMNCPDCITKHLNKISAYIDEAKGLLSNVNEEFPNFRTMVANTIDVVEQRHNNVFKQPDVATDGVYQLFIKKGDLLLNNVLSNRRELRKDVLTLLNNFDHVKK